MAIALPALHKHLPVGDADDLIGSRIECGTAECSRCQLESCGGWRRPYHTRQVCGDRDGVLCDVCTEHKHFACTYQSERDEIGTWNKRTIDRHAHAHAEDGVGIRCANVLVEFEDPTQSIGKKVGVPIRVALV